VMPAVAPAASPDRRTMALPRLPGPPPGVPPTPVVCTAHSWRSRIPRGPGRPCVLRPGVLALPSLGRSVNSVQKFNLTAVSFKSPQSGQDSETPYSPEEDNSETTVAALASVLDTLEQALSSNAPNSPLPGGRSAAKSATVAVDSKLPGEVVRPAFTSQHTAPSLNTMETNFEARQSPRHLAMVADLSTRFRTRRRSPLRFQPTEQFLDTYCNVGEVPADVRHPAWTDSDKFSARRAALGRAQEARRSALKRLLGSGQTSAAAEEVHRRGRSKPPQDNSLLLRSTLKAMVAQRRELAESRQLLQQTLGGNETSPTAVVGARGFITTTRTAMQDARISDGALVGRSKEERGPFQIRLVYDDELEMCKAISSPTPRLSNASQLGFPAAS